ncbi:unnamed protein product [Echinostoma caproni]|uniref:ASMase_C domain-containing protein n=1 Tax=Echinostoma caproni TaxID=27848 RepID=A0A183AGX5_9TREM|nr:unnamed protein product [Echinostoma caproni]
MENVIQNSSDYWGSYEKDTSTLVAFTGIEKGNDEGYAENQPDFVIFGGGSGPLKEKTDEEDLLKSMEFIVHHLKQAFNIEDIPLFPVMGKYDIFPAATLPVGPEDWDRILWCKKLAMDERLWKQWIDMALDTVSVVQKLPLIRFEEGCYHSMLIGKNPKILLLGVNSLAWYRNNEQINSSYTDPLNQFLWMEKSLKWARENKAKVLLITHIPPGAQETNPNARPLYLDQYNDRIIEYIRDYSDVITAVLSGYGHTDTFRVILDKSYHPITTVLMSPSMDPRHISGTGSFNPRIRQYKYSRSTGRILDYRQFYLNLTQKHPQWELEYVARDEYKLQDLSPQSLADLLDVFTSTDNENGWWDAFWKHLLGGGKHDPVNEGDGNCPKSDSRCRCEFVCAMRHLDTKEFDPCRKICKSDNPKLPTIHDLINPPHPEPEPDTGGSSTGVIVGSVVGVLCVVLAAGGGAGYYFYRKRRG